MYWSSLGNTAISPRKSLAERCSRASRPTASSNVSGVTKGSAIEGSRVVDAATELGAGLRIGVDHFGGDPERGGGACVVGFLCAIDVRFRAPSG